VSSLHPIPVPMLMPDISFPRTPSHIQTHPYASTSTGGLSFSDLSLVRRRKSTGSSKINKPRPITLLPPPPRPHPQPTHSQQPIASGSRSAYPPHQHSGRPTSAPTSPKLSHKSLAPISTSIPYHPHTSPIPTIPPKSSNQNLRFSTADRTILEELKRNISARNAQFVVKGPVVGEGKKHHPYRKEEVPYPRNYEREVLDL
jgi:hypothetical protein